MSNTSSEPFHIHLTFSVDEETGQHVCSADAGALNVSINKGPTMFIAADAALQGVDFPDDEH